MALDVPLCCAVVLVSEDTLIFGTTVEPRAGSSMENIVPNLRKPPALVVLKFCLACQMTDKRQLILPGRND